MGAKDGKYNLGEFEALVMMAILRLRDNAYGVTIRREIESVGGRAASIGAVYTTLDRMEEKGFVSGRQGEATPERGGKAKRYYKIEGSGLMALEHMREAQARMLAGINLEGVKAAGGVL